MKCPKCGTVMAVPKEDSCKPILGGLIQIKKYKNPSCPNCGPSITEKRPWGCLALFPLFVFTFIVSGLLGYLLLPLPEIYAPGESPHRNFPLVAFVPKGSQQEKKQYIFMKWKDYTSTDMGKYLFRLPEKQGELPHPYSDYDIGTVTFNVLQENDHEQLVEVNFSDEDYPVIGKYVVSGNDVIPQSFEHWVVGNFVVFGILGVIVVGILSGMVMRRRK